MFVCEFDIFGICVLIICCLILQKRHWCVMWDCPAWTRGPALRTTRPTPLVRANGPMTRPSAPRGGATTAKAPPTTSSRQIREILRRETPPPFITWVSHFVSWLLINCYYVLVFVPLRQRFPVFSGIGLLILHSARKANKHISLKCQTLPLKESLRRKTAFEGWNI